MRPRLWLAALPLALLVTGCADIHLGRRHAYLPVGCIDWCGPGPMPGEPCHNQAAFQVTARSDAVVLQAPDEPASRRFFPDRAARLRLTGFVVMLCNAVGDRFEACEVTAESRPDLGMDEAALRYAATLRAPPSPRPRRADIHVYFNIVGDPDACPAPPAP